MDGSHAWSPREGREGGNLCSNTVLLGCGRGHTWQELGSDRWLQAGATGAGSRNSRAVVFRVLDLLLPGRSSNG